MVLAYISGPIVHGCLRKDDFYACAVTALEKMGVEVFAPQFLSNRGPEEVYKRDIEKVRESDFLVAEVSDPSLGVGMELMLAIELSKPILLFRHKNARPLSFMVRGAPGNVLFEYSSIEEADSILRGIEIDRLILRKCNSCSSNVAVELEGSTRCVGCSTTNK